MKKIAIGLFCSLFFLLNLYAASNMDNMYVESINETLRTIRNSFKHINSLLGSKKENAKSELLYQIKSLNNFLLDADPYWTIIYARRSVEGFTIQLPEFPKGLNKDTYSSAEKKFYLKEKQVYEQLKKADTNVAVAKLKTILRILLGSWNTFKNAYDTITDEDIINLPSNLKNMVETAKKDAESIQKGFDSIKSAKKKKEMLEKLKNDLINIIREIRSIQYTLNSYTFYIEKLKENYNHFKQEAMAAMSRDIEEEKISVSEDAKSEEKIEAAKKKIENLHTQLNNMGIKFGDYLSYKWGIIRSLTKELFGINAHYKVNSKNGKITIKGFKSFSSKFKDRIKAGDNTPVLMDNFLEWAEAIDKGDYDNRYNVINTISNYANEYDSLINKVIPNFLNGNYEISIGLEQFSPVYYKGKDLLADLKDYLKFKVISDSFINYAAYDYLSMVGVAISSIENIEKMTYYPQSELKKIRKKYGYFPLSIRARSISRNQFLNLIDNTKKITEKIDDYPSEFSNRIADIKTGILGFKPIEEKLKDFKNYISRQDVKVYFDTSKIFDSTYGSFFINNNRYKTRYSFKDKFHVLEGYYFHFHINNFSDKVGEFEQLLEYIDSVVNYVDVKSQQLHDQFNNLFERLNADDDKELFDMKRVKELTISLKRYKNLTELLYKIEKEFRDWTSRGCKDNKKEYLLKLVNGLKSYSGVYKEYKNLQNKAYLLAQGLLIYPEDEKTVANFLSLIFVPGIVDYDDVKSPNRLLTMINTNCYNNIDFSNLSYAGQILKEKYEEMEKYSKELFSSHTETSFHKCAKIHSDVLYFVHYYTSYTKNKGALGYYKRIENIWNNIKKEINRLGMKYIKLVKDETAELEKYENKSSFINSMDDITFNRWLSNFDNDLKSKMGRDYELLRSIDIGRISKVFQKYYEEKNKLIKLRDIRKIHPIVESVFVEDQPLNYTNSFFICRDQLKSNFIVIRGHAKTYGTKISRVYAWINGSLLPSYSSIGTTDWTIKMSRPANSCKIKVKIAAIDIAGNQSQPIIFTINYNNESFKDSISKLLNQLISYYESKNFSGFSQLIDINYLGGYDVLLDGVQSDFKNLNNITIQLYIDRIIPSENNIVVNTHWIKQYNDSSNNAVKKEGYTEFLILRGKNLKIFSMTMDPLFGETSDSPFAENGLPHGTVTLTGSEGGLLALDLENQKIVTVGWPNADRSTFDITNVGYYIGYGNNAGYVDLGVVDFKSLKEIPADAVFKTFSSTDNPWWDGNTSDLRYQINHVLGIKTRSGKYAKILIKNFYDDGTKTYVTIDWVYQPNGTMKF